MIALAVLGLVGCDPTEVDLEGNLWMCRSDGECGAGWVCQKAVGAESGACRPAGSPADVVVADTADAEDGVVGSDAPDAASVEVILWDTVDSADCTADKDCDDGDPCTLDWCSKGACQHAADRGCGDADLHDAVDVADVADAPEVVSDAADALDLVDVADGFEESDAPDAAAIDTLDTGEGDADADSDGDATEPECTGVSVSNPCLHHVWGSEQGCVLVALPPGTPCDDGNACTKGDKCSALAVCGGVTIGCNDGNPCTADGCDPETGCVAAPIDDLACDDGNPCTPKDACEGGECLSGPTNLCQCDPTEDLCEATFGNANACDGTLSCKGFFCVVDKATLPLPCPPGDDVCLPNACSPGDGVCKPVAAAAGVVCDDGAECTLGDGCDGQGSCKSTSTLSCDDSNACTLDVCNGGTAQCVHLGICACTSTKDCGSAPTPCIKPACVSGACTLVPAPDGAVECDGDPCTGGDACYAGVCHGGDPLSCDDGDPCTADACQAGGCLHTPTPLAVPEVCNGQDDDCDGEVDEGFGVGDECADHVGGPCRRGVVVCADGAAACVAGSPRSQGAPCGAPSCADGVAVPEATCDGSGICVPGSPLSCAGYGCEADACGTTCSEGLPCMAGWVCFGEDCVLPCLVDADCAGGEHCDGVCQLDAEGGACDELSDCVLGLTCMGGWCATPSGEGEPCDLDVHCGAGLYCAELDGLCVVGGALGAPCTSASDCAGLACRVGWCAPPAGIGESCEGVGTCAAGAWCPPWSGTCVSESGTGQPCVASLECVAGHTCNGTLCAPEQGLLGPCEDDGGCAPGLHCDEPEGTCVPDGEPGSPCGVPSDCAAGLVCPAGACLEAGTGGASCTVDALCAQGYHCDEPTQQCTPDLPLGAPCVTASDCAGLLVCRAGQCALPGIVGVPCAKTADCLPGLHCSKASGQCEVGGGPGTPCETTPCAAPLTCTPNGCAAPPGPGAPCESECQAGHHCAGGICAPDAPLGASCGSANECAKPAVCKDGTCALPAGAGAPCDTAADCGPGYACKTECAPLQPYGAPCAAAQQCGSEYCANTYCCDQGACCAGDADCDDGNSCTTDSCDTAFECVYAPWGGGCDDGNPCTEDFCDPVTGVCGHDNAASGTVCNDTDACTLGECNDNGQCIGTLPDCDDYNPCTMDSCAAGACTYTGNPGIACNDGNKCTLNDECGGAEGKICGGTVNSCDDGNPCTSDACNPGGAGDGCVHINNTANCVDGDACTSGDKCSGGVCTGANVAVTCNDNNSCTVDYCNPATGQCVYANIAANTVCTDNDGCTVGDKCNGSGSCLGAPVNCDDDNPCTDDACDPVQGCAHAPNANECDDDDACTQPDLCVDGGCLGIASVDCADGNPCTDDGCGAAVGCVYEPNTLPCDDGDPCTYGDVCAAMTCGGLPSVGCSGCAPGLYRDGDYCVDAADCTEGTWADPVSQHCASCDSACALCSGPGVTDCVACPEGQFLHAGTCNAKCPDQTVPDESAGECIPCAYPCATCTGTVSHCMSCEPGQYLHDGTCAPTCGAVPFAAYPDPATGMCLPCEQCDDAEFCTEDLCDPIVGCAHVPREGPCDDDNPCTTPDKCADGVCMGLGELNCDDSNPCTNDTCSLTAGCSYSNNTIPCNDSNVCTHSEKCMNGSCTDVLPVTCDDGNVCTADSCDVFAGCQYGPKSGPCTDNNACTDYDTCVGSSCQSGTPKVCNDGKMCTTDSCIVATGCKFSAVTGVDCDDDNACTTTDKCWSGTCVGTNGLYCNDNDPCTTDSCNPATGLCQFLPGLGACNDGNVCTADSCDPVSGCVNAPWEGSCDDADPCTADDTCVAGLCAGEPNACDDGDVCTADTCTAATGACSHTPIAGCTKDMVVVPAGEFWMGCNAVVDTECGSNEVPQHQVTLSAYQIDRTEVTVAAWEACVAAGGCSVPTSVSSCSPGQLGTYGATGKEQHPVTCVTWTQSSAFCAWAGKRLCTEAEWEKAARGGCEKYPGQTCSAAMPKYPWGNAEASCAYAVMYEDELACGANSTWTVGSKPTGASPYGALDMAGNVWEWVSDWYETGYYSTSPSSNPQGPGSGSMRVFRGGAIDYDDPLRASSRFGAVPSELPIDVIGLRCCRSVQD